jgi:hypothetical protein
VVRVIVSAMKLCDDNGLAFDEMLRLARLHHRR